MSVMTRRKWVIYVLCYLLLAAAAVAVGPMVGAESLDLATVIRQLFSGEGFSIDTEIFMFQRLPRVLLAILAGGSLALVGSVFQVILRNPLAAPYTLGVTGGSAVGAVLAISVPALAFSAGPFNSPQILSLAGAAVTLGLLYAIARRPDGVSMNTLLLAGVTVGILCSAIILLIRYLASPDLLVAMDRWLMGGLDVVGYGELATILPLVVPGIGLLFMQASSLNHLSIGSEMATGHGVDVRSVQRICFFAGGLTTAGVVSLAGPIGFVGLLVPHMVRRISGLDHRVVLVGSFMAGGAFLVISDAIARTIVAPTEMPVGVITAVIGGPFFVYLLLKSK